MSEDAAGEVLATTFTAGALALSAPDAAESPPNAGYVDQTAIQHVLAVVQGTELKTDQTLPGALHHQH